MEDNTMNKNDCALLEVKPEPTELSNLTKSQCSNTESENFTIAEYKTEPLYPENTILVKGEQLTQVSISSSNVDKPCNSKEPSTIGAEESIGRNYYTTANKHTDIRQNESKHVCNICNKSFKTRRYVVGHMLSHTDEKNYKCEICLKSFKRTSNLSNHMKCHSDERKYKCYICTKSFKSKRDIADHMIFHSDERNHKCTICSKSFKRKKDLVNHVKYHSDERNHKCTICTKNFTTRLNALSHMKCHTYERNHKCDICTKSFKRKSEVVKHMKCHTDERNHKCDVCTKTYKRKSDLVSHMKKHTQPNMKVYRNHIEQPCKNMLENNTNLDKQRYVQTLPNNTHTCNGKEHVDGFEDLSIMNNLKEENFEMDISDMKNKFTTNENKNDSNNLFLEVKPEPTEISNLEQSSQCSIAQSILTVAEYKIEPSYENTTNEDVKENVVSVPNTHIKNLKCISTSSDNLNVSRKITHKNKTNYKCAICNKSFKRKSNLSAHLKCHTDEKNHKCDICAKGFKRRSDVISHKKCHTDEKPHKCNTCETSFKTKNNMLDHMKRHPNEKKYKCNICTKCFKTNSNLSQHIKYHSNERNHTCSICSKSFKTKQNMVNHLKCHTVVRNHVCDICSKRFKTKIELLMHINCHTDEKIYKCNICTKGFKTLSNMKDHMKCHTHERNYECYTCSKNFKRKNELVNHMNCHTDDKNHVCDICSKRFKTRRKMLHHIGKHAKSSIMEYTEANINGHKDICGLNETNVQCAICRIIFVDKNALKNHIEQHCEKMSCNNKENEKDLLEFHRNLSRDKHHKEVGSFLKQGIMEDNFEMDIAVDTTETDLSRGINENKIHVTIMNEEPKLTTTFNELHMLSSEITIKDQEENAKGTSSLINTPPWTTSERGTHILQI